LKNSNPLYHIFFLYKALLADEVNMEGKERVKNTDNANTNNQNGADSDNTTSESFDI